MPDEDWLNARVPMKPNSTRKVRIVPADKLPCGHPAACATCSDPHPDDTWYCGWCAEMGRYRVALADCIALGVYPRSAEGLVAETDILAAEMRLAESED